MASDGRKPELKIEDLSAKLTGKPYSVRVVPSFSALYKDVAFLGKGTYGEVKRVQVLDPTIVHQMQQLFGPDCGNECAVKIVKKKRIATAKDPEKSLKRLLMELWVLRHGRHPNLLKLVDALQDDQYIYLVTNLVVGDMLLNYLNNHIMAKKPIKMDDIKIIMRQLLLALHALHSMGVVHRDIKLENVLVDEKLKVTLIDFGFAKQCSSQWIQESPSSSPTIAQMSFDDTLNGMGVPLTPGIGSVGYTPEDYLSWWIAEKEYKTTKHCVQAIDVFGSGVILYTLVYCRLPFQFQATTGKDAWRALAARMQCGATLTKQACFNVVVPDELRDVLSQMLHTDPEKRPKALEILRHPFLYIQGMTPLMPKPQQVTFASANEAKDKEDAAHEEAPSVDNSSKLMKAIRTLDEDEQEGDDEEESKDSN